MKNKKSLLLFLILSLVIALSCLGGCIKNNLGDGLTIVSIEKTHSEGLKDFYTITYSDGSYYTFEIVNGKDGTDGQDLDIEEIYAKYLINHPNTTYEEFLKDVLNINSTSNTLSINKALQSCAKIYTEFTQSYRTGSVYTKETALCVGSAVVYKVDQDYTYFITNFHVVYDNEAIETTKIAKKIVCYLYGSEGGPVSTNTKDENGCTIYNYGEYAISCEYVGGSITADIAIVKAPTADVMTINENVKPITFAKEYCVGETAIAIGNPEGEGISVTEGIISVDNEYITLSIGESSREYRSIRIDTAIYHGSSGGGLFNKDGELIGITNAGDDADQNVNYAIPLQIVKGAVENIMHYGNGAKKIKLGIEVEMSNSKYVYDSQTGKGKIVEKITIVGIDSGSISESIGLQEGDIILSIFVNGAEYVIDRSFNIGDLLYNVRSDDEICFKISRLDQTMTTLSYTVLTTDLNQIA